MDSQPLFGAMFQMIVGSATIAYMAVMAGLAIFKAFKPAEKFELGQEPVSQKKLDEVETKLERRIETLADKFDRNTDTLNEVRVQVNTLVAVENLTDRLVDKLAHRLQVGKDDIRV